jgi:hypothetical protein
MQKTSKTTIVETTIEKMERAVKLLQKGGWPRSKAIDYLIAQLEEGGATTTAQLARNNLK